MKPLFESANYLDFLKFLAYGENSKRGYQVQMARAMGCQAAYLSQVLKGTAELTEDHAAKLALFLKLSESATDYLIVLVREARAATPELKSYLVTQRKKVLERNEDIKNRIPSSSTSFSTEELLEYFSSWIPSTVHTATSSKNFQTAENIGDRLSLPVEKVLETLQRLQELGLVERTDSQWKFSTSPLHFSKDSLANDIHQINRRMQAIRSIEVGDKKDIHFSSIFTIDKSAFQAIKNELLEYIERSHKEIHASGTEELYGMCLDLFRVV